VSEASHARSAGSYRTRPAFRRSTAFSCRRTSNSAFFAGSPRHTTTVRPNNQRMISQMILISIRSANHHRVTGASETAGERHDRVLGQHRYPVRVILPAQVRRVD